MLIIQHNQIPQVFGIQLSKNYPKTLEYDITPIESEYSWEKKYRDPHIIPKPKNKRNYKIDYYIEAFKHRKQYTLHRLIKYNGESLVINHIDDLTDDQKEFLILQLC